jgi:hypothetical protein
LAVRLTTIATRSQNDLVSVTIEAAPGIDAMIRDLGLDHPDRWRSFGAGDLVNRTSRGFVRRFCWPAGDGGVFYFKLYTLGRPWKKLVSVFRRDPARREYDNLAWLRAHGFPAVEPVAWGARRTARVVRSCFVVTRGEPDTETLDVLARASADRRRWIVPLARLLRGLHDAGFFAHDLHFRNVLVKSGGAGLVLLDLPNGRLIPADDTRRERAVVYDLAMLERDAARDFSRTDQLRFLTSYLGDASVDRDLIRAIAACRDRQLARRRLATRRRALMPGPPG